MTTQSEQQAEEYLKIKIIANKFEGEAHSE